MKKIIISTMLLFSSTLFAASTNNEKSEFDMRRKTQCDTYGGTWRDSDKTCSFRLYEIIDCLQKNGLYNFHANECVWDEGVWDEGIILNKKQ